MKPLLLALSLCLAGEALAVDDLADEASRTCASYGFRPGTEAFAACSREVTLAIARRAVAAEATVSCTPMGAHTVCQ